MHRASKQTRETADALLDRRGDTERRVSISRRPDASRITARSRRDADDASGALIKTSGPARVCTREPIPVETSNSHNVGLRAVRTHRSLFASVGGGPRHRATSTPLARIALATEATLRLVVRACANCARTRLAIST